MVALRWLAGMASLLWLSFPCASATSATNKVMAGWLEPGYLAELPAHKVKLKLDTGAKTSSIHARNIETFRRDGKPWVRFELVLKGIRGETKTITLERPRLRTVLIKEHDGRPGKRSVVKLELCFSDRMQPAEFTLADRTEFNYSVLLGRRFMAGLAVVDPQQTYLTQPDCAPATNNKGANDMPRKS
jgi:hypothetical protein